MEKENIRKRGRISHLTLLVVMAMVALVGWGIFPPSCSSSETKPTWAKAFGGKEGDLALSIIQTKDGGFALVGMTESFGAGGSDLWLLRLDEEGNLSPPFAPGFTVTNTNCVVTNTSAEVFATQAEVTNTNAQLTDTNASVTNTNAEVTWVAGESR